MPTWAHQLLDALVTGIAQGAMIALVALFYSMVYGVLKLINFAHSEIFMMGAYVGLFAIMALGGEANPILATAAGTVIAMLACSALGVASNASRTVRFAVVARARSCA